MKKFLSIMMALVLCLSFSVLAFAEDADTAGDNAAIATGANASLEDILNKFIGLVEAASEDNESAITDAADGLKEALSGVNTSDLTALADTLKKYAESAGVDASAVVKDLGAFEDVLSKFMNDSGFDLEAIEADLKDENSPLSKIVGLYAGAYQKTPEVPTTTAAPEEPTEVPNPPTGENATGVIAALSVLAVSAAAFVVCTKKKED